jgi:predicted Zn-dependent protease
VGDQIQRRQVMPTCSYISQVELSVTFGLSDSETIDKVVIRWPDGTRQELTELAVDQRHIITQPGQAE